MEGARERLRDMDPADFYSGIVVDAYAKLKSSTFVAAPYIDFVRTHGEPGLEVGCGDGQPLLDLCEAGLDVEGVDSSMDMVVRARENAAERGIRTGIYCQRVEGLRLPRRFASIYFAGPTFNLLADDTTAARALRAIREHLTDDGAALIPLWVPNPTPENEFGVARTADDSGVQLRYTPLTETYDEDQRTRTTSSRYERVTPEGTETADREWIIHWHTPGSFRELCHDAYLEVVRIVDDHTDGPASEASVNFTAVVRRRSEDSQPTRNDK